MDRRLTADELESNYRAERRAAGEKLYIVANDDWSKKTLRELDRYCELKQTSRSEVARGLYKRALILRKKALQKAVRASTGSRTSSGSFC